MGKFFHNMIDQEMCFLGVELTSTGLVLNKTKKHKMEQILHRCNFIPTVLHQCSSTCKLCMQVMNAPKIPKSLKCQIEEQLKRKYHYHTVMPKADGNLHDLFSKYPHIDLSQRFGIFFSIAQAMDNLRTHNVLNLDIRMANVLYTRIKKTVQVFPCDVGGLYQIGEIPFEAKHDQNIRYRAGRVMADTQSKDTHPLWWGTATYINPFLELENTNSNFDYSEVSHLTNQFSLLAFFMELMMIKPPDHSMVKDRESIQEFKSKYSSSSDYLRRNSKILKLKHPRESETILNTVDEIWHDCSKWTLFSKSPEQSRHSQTCYIQNIMDRMIELRNQLFKIPSTTRLKRRSSQSQNPLKTSKIL